MAIPVVPQKYPAVQMVAADDCARQYAPSGHCTCVAMLEPVGQK
jgi:hypothetical protein